MREASGGTLLLQIVLIFLTVYIGFMAVVINYGRVFRYKNTIINRIEQNEGFNSCETLDDMIKATGYLGNYEVTYTTTTKGTIYNVKIYISFTLPLLSPDNPLIIPVKGETRLIDTDFNQNLREEEVCRR